MFSFPANFQDLIFKHIELVEKKAWITHLLRFVNTKHYTFTECAKIGKCSHSIYLYIYSSIKFFGRSDWLSECKFILTVYIICVHIKLDVVSVQNVTNKININNSMMLSCFVWSYNFQIQVLRMPFVCLLFSLCLYLYIWMVIYVWEEL